jgi:hypothetical protein
MDYRFKNTHLRLLRNRFIGGVIAAAATLSIIATDSVGAATIAQVSPSVVQLSATKPTTNFSSAEIRYMQAVHVNTMTYNYNDSAPALEAFRIVTAHRGWTNEEIASWEVAVTDIMRGESGFCPNLLRGARLAKANGCVLSRQGRHSDAGFGQLIGIHYKLSSKNSGAGWLCRQEGLCSKWDIIATPWNSMTALVAMVERSGVQPWCFNAKARRFHSVACKNPGFDV